MSFLLSIIITILILSIIVIVHEFGHFILARKNSVFVEEFSIGFGPRLISRIGKKGTRFSIKLIWFGGSCQMKGEFDEETSAEDAFNNKSVWARMSIVLAGPVFNILLACVLSVLFISIAGYDLPTVTSVEENSAAEEAGLEEGDLILRYNGSKINFGKEIYLYDYLNPLSDEEITIVYKRDGEKYTTTITPDETEKYVMGIYYQESDSLVEITGAAYNAEEAGLKEGDILLAINGTYINNYLELQEYLEENPLSEEPISVTYERNGETYETTLSPTLITQYSSGFSYNLSYERGNAISTLKYSVAEVRYAIMSTVKSIGYLLSGNASLDDVAGPVGLISVVSETYETSAEYGNGLADFAQDMLSMIILISVSLGIFNMLPIPALDGGRFVLLIVEAVRKKPLNSKTEGIINAVGFALVILLSLVILTNDIINLF